MYAKHRIGVVISHLNGSEGVHDLLIGIPPFIDQIYIIAKDQKEPPQEFNGDSRVTILPRNGHNTRESLSEAYQRAIKDDMDVVVSMDDTPQFTSNNWSNLLDPIVWGEANYTRNIAVKNAYPVRSIENPMSDAILSSQIKMASTVPPIMETLRGKSALSRSALDATIKQLTGTDKKIPGLLIAIPCYNEEIAIGSILLKAREYSDDILVINDGSFDATSDIAEKAGVVLITHPKNRGKADAIMTAVQYARNKEFDYLVLLDGDGQHNVDEIPLLLNPILNKQSDLVIGSRFITEKGKNKVPSYRRLGQKTLDMVSNASSAFKCTDSQSGYRALSRRAMEHLTVASEGYNIESDMIRQLSADGLSISEVPISVRYYTPNGHKKNSFYHGFDIFSHLLGLISYERPLLAFGVPGLIFVCAGIFLGAYVIPLYYTTGEFHYLLFIGGIVAEILGLLFIIAGFIMNSIAHVIKSQKIAF